MIKWKFSKNLAFNVIMAVVLLIVFFGVVVSVMGYISFTESMTREYVDSAYHSAYTATSLLDGGKIDDYLAGGEDDADYSLSQSRLDILCERMNLTLIYVIKVDTSDYGRFVSVFNSVNKNADKVLNPETGRYSRWEAGFKRDTTNDDYREKYRRLYEKETTHEEIFRTTDLKGAEPHLTSLCPVTDGAGNVTAIMCVQRPMNELVNGRKPYIINIVITTVVLSVFVSVIYAIYIRRQLVSPLKKIINEADRFARERSENETPFNDRISKISEIKSLASSVRTMESDMLNYIENLMNITAEKQRINTELSLATRIQADMLPNVFPAFPDRPEFDIHATMNPAKEVGGDFYDFFLIDDDHLCMVMADVSGKGVPAALFMMASKIILANNAMLGKSPAQILTDTNAAICAHNREEMFVTVWLGILEISTGKLIAANAGHEYPVLMQPDGEFELVKDKHGFVIGGMGGIKYKEYELQLTAGAKLFLYTDGVPEATNADNELFGTERMLATLNESKEALPEKLLENVRVAVDSFVNGAEQFDDLTMLGLEYKGDKNERS